MLARAAFTLLAAAACSVAFAHSALKSFVRLEFAEQSIRADMMVPRDEQLPQRRFASSPSSPWMKAFLESLKGECTSRSISALTNGSYVTPKSYLIRVTSKAIRHIGSEWPQSGSFGKR